MITAGNLIQLIEADCQTRGLSAARYAAFLDISKSYYSRLINEKRKPSISFLKILKEKLPALRPEIEAYAISQTDNNKT